MAEHIPIRQTFLQSMQGKEAFLKRLFTVFLQHEPGRVADLRHALEKDDLPKVRYLAHSLKGSAATMGADGLKDRCLDLEKSAEKGDRNRSLACMSSLEGSINEVYEFMSRFMDEH